MNLKEIYQVKFKSSRSYFTKEEDKLLQTLVDSQKKIKWNEISLQVQGKTPRKCRDRWKNYLSPEIKIENWSNEEDNILFEKVQRYGRKWIDIACFLPGRTTNDIKNRYHVKIKNQIKKENSKKEEKIEKIGKTEKTEKTEKIEKEKNNIFDNIELCFLPNEEEFDWLNHIY
jgi:hypothetical protein